MTLDDTIDRATFLKIDVEGHELSVLKGGSEIIAQTEPSMHISAYHYPQDIPDLGIFMKTNQSLFTWDINLPIYDTNIIVRWLVLEVSHVLILAPKLIGAYNLSTIFSLLF